MCPMDAYAATIVVVVAYTVRTPLLLAPFIACNIEHLELPRDKATLYYRIAGNVCMVQLFVYFAYSPGIRN